MLSHVHVGVADFQRAWSFYEAVLPLLGLIFLLFTTLMWVLLDAPPVGIHGFDWLWIILAVLLDLSHYVGAYAQRDQLPGRSTGDRPPPPPCGDPVEIPVR